VCNIKDDNFIFCDERNHHFLTVSVEQQCIRLLKKRNTKLKYYCKNNFFDLVLLYCFIILLRPRERVITVTRKARARE